MSASHGPVPGIRPRRTRGTAAWRRLVAQTRLTPAELVLPILKPKAHLPVHWDGLWNPFLAGVTQPYSDPALEKLLASSGVNLLAPRQYMDKWRLDANGTRAISNEGIQKQLGFH